MTEAQVIRRLAYALEKQITGRQTHVIHMQKKYRVKTKRRYTIQL